MIQTPMANNQCKTTFILICVAASVLLLSTPSFAQSDCKEKVDICHAPDGQDPFLIRISACAVDAHLERHPGDFEADAADPECDPPGGQPLLECPCWDDFTLDELSNQLNQLDVDDPNCEASPQLDTAFAEDDYDTDPALRVGPLDDPVTTYRCVYNVEDDFRAFQFFADDKEDVRAYEQCLREMRRIVSQTLWCAE